MSLLRSLIALQLAVGIAVAVALYYALTVPDRQERRCFEPEDEDDQRVTAERLSRDGH